MLPIKHRYTDKIIYECDAAETIKEAAENAVKSDSDLSYSNLSNSDLRDINLSGGDLSGCDLRDSNLSGCNLSGSDLSYCDLSGGDLRGCDLRDSDLRDSDLRDCDLRGCDLRDSDLSYCDLRGCDLRGCDLSGCKGLLNATSYMQDNFESDDKGIIVYKRIGKTLYPQAKHWKIEVGAFIEEVVNPLPTADCGCGVNFGTLAWCKKNYTEADLWKCRIRWIDLASIVVPYNTDGKCRCARLELLKTVPIASFFQAVTYPI